MAKVVLVSFAGYPLTANSFFPDNGLANLASALRAAGHEPRILDFNTPSTLRRLISPAVSAELGTLHARLHAEPAPLLLERLLEVEAALEERLAGLTGQLSEQVAAELAGPGRKLVGFKLWSGHGCLASISIAEGLRRLFPDLLIVGGGPAVLYSGAALYRLTNVFDFLVHGEGELAAVGLADYLERRAEPSAIPNLLFRVGDSVRSTRRVWIDDLDERPLPCYDVDTYPSLEGDEHIKLFVLDDSRGCPKTCNFCIHHLASGRTWRRRSGERVLAQMEALRATHGATCFRLGGSNTPAALYEDLATVMPHGRGGYSFSGFADPAGIRVEALDLLASAGCTALFFGVESFDEADARALGKRLLPARSGLVIDECRRIGIVPAVSLVAPIPGQGGRSVEANRQAVLRHCGSGDATVMVSIPALLPGTRWWEERERFGFALHASDEDYRRILATYTIRQIIPPSAWAPLPYSLEGRSFRELCQESADFQRALADQGVVLNVQDDAVLLARALDLSLPAIQQKLERLFFTLDSRRITELVQRANRGLRAVAA